MLAASSAALWACHDRPCSNNPRAKRAAELARPIMADPKSEDCVSAERSLDLLRRAAVKTNRGDACKLAGPLLPDGSAGGRLHLDGHMLATGDDNREVRDNQTRPLARRLSQDGRGNSLRSVQCAGAVCHKDREISNSGKQQAHFPDASWSCGSAPGRRSNPRVSAWLVVRASDLPCPHRSARNEGAILSHVRKRIAPLTQRLDSGSSHVTVLWRLCEPPVHSGEPAG